MREWRWTGRENLVNFLTFDFVFFAPEFLPLICNRKDLSTAANPFLFIANMCLCYCQLP
jgi:hypothetical protein